MTRRVVPRRGRGGAPAPEIGSVRTGGTAGSTATRGTVRLGGLRRVLALIPEVRPGLEVTLLLALLATAGRIVVPLTVQQTLDRGLLAPGGPDLGVVGLMVSLAAAAIVVTAVSAYLMNYRLFRTTETTLAALRVRAFRHVHNLSMLHQQTERRGSLVSRVTSDVDQLSTFMQWGGILVVISVGQLLLATVLMALYSWQLTVLVWVCFIPLVLAMRVFQRRLGVAYGRVRARVGDLLGAVAESVVGAETIRAYGVADRTSDRIDTAIDRHYRSSISAQTLTALVFVSGELMAAVANTGVIVVGVLLGIGGQISTGELVAFLFLVTLFVGPVQVSTEALNEAQNAVASFRRVLEVLGTEPDVADPGPDGVPLPPGALDIRFDHVGFAYPDGPEVLHDVRLHLEPHRRFAVVGETGSGKTTLVKLLTRLMDPTTGQILVGGVPLSRVSFTSLRQRVVMVPQDGFLFDATVADNVRYGRPDATDDEVAAAFASLGLGDWLASLPHGVATPVGERGGALSVGERQLVAIARAYLADPDVLVLDEATSAVDPATEVRLARALASLTRGRTAISIAHRLSTAESADEVIVVDSGRIAQRGPHDRLVTEPGPYARLYASWAAQQRS
ncbi:MAG TPA: ABC transporter ATP-binding protein [Mycobacteriales bacterium]